MQAGFEPFLLTLVNILKKTKKKSGGGVVGWTRGIRRDINRVS